MTILTTPPGFPTTHFSYYGGSTIAISPVNEGDLIILFIGSWQDIEDHSGSAVTVTGVSGRGTKGWVKIQSVNYPTAIGNSTEGTYGTSDVWVGVATAVGPTSVKASWSWDLSGSEENSPTETQIFMVCQSLTAGLGADTIWPIITSAHQAVDVPGHTDYPTTTYFPSLVSDGSLNQAYFGFTQNASFYLTSKPLSGFTSLEGYQPDDYSGDTVFYVMTWSDALSVDTTYSPSFVTHTEGGFDYDITSPNGSVAFIVTATPPNTGSSTAAAMVGATGVVDILSTASSSAKAGVSAQGVVVLSGTANIGATVGVLEVPTGIPDQVPISILPIGYDGLQLNWTAPTGLWTEQILLRSSYGTLLDIYSEDGAVVFDEALGIGSPAYSTQYVDTNLRPGRFYYYSLFVYSPILQEYVLVAAAQGLVITDYGFRHTYFTWTPEWYLDADQLQTVTQYSNDGPLVRFLQLLGYETDWIRSEIESFYLFNNAELISGALLPYLGYNYGMTYEPDLGMTRSRVLVKNAVHLYKTKGTLEGIQAAASAYTGFSTEVSIGTNLEIQLDDAAFDRSQGHWLPANNGTSISLINPTAYGNITPPHTNYEPLPTIMQSQIPTMGYLPTNNENVLQLSAQSASSWSNLLPSLSPPAARQFGSMVYDPVNTNVILFGGQDGNGVLHNDTWSWNGVVWTQLSPVTSPPARMGAVFKWNTAKSNGVMFGGQGTGGLLNDTWVWTGSNWLKKNPSTIPPARSQASSTYDSSIAEVVMFGGIGASGSLADMWLWDGTNWTLVSEPFISGPSIRDTAQVAYNSDTGNLVLFGGGSAFASGVASQGPGTSVDTWIWNGVWVQVTTAHSPPPRLGGVMWYDSVRKRTYLFGGSSGLGDGWPQYGDPPRYPTPVPFLNDTWEFDGTDWTQLSPATSPGNRILACAAFDDVNGNAIMFGGYTTGATDGSILSDTWSFNGTNWTSLSPATVPSPRVTASITWDPVHSAITMFGGCRAVKDGPSRGGGGDPRLLIPSQVWTNQISNYYYGDYSGTFFNDTWTWSGTNWVLKSPSTSPPVRAGASFSFDSVSNHLILFGGEGGGGGVDQVAILQDTWSWNGTNWSQLSPATIPRQRANAAMAAARSGNLVMFGGIDLLTGGGSNPTTSNDTWLWTGTNWVEPINLPVPRFAAAMSYDAHLGEVVLFGGNTINGIAADTWAWNDTTFAWTQLTPLASPPARYGGPMVYDSATTTDILFGGFGASGLLGDTWSFNGVTWIQSIHATPQVTPSARYGDAFVYDTNLTKVVMFGGLSALGVLNDIWECNNLAWTQVFSFQYPPPRDDASMTYHATNTSVIMFGGNSANGYLNDTWTWNGSAWTEQAPSVMPPARSGAVLTFNANNNTSVLFGGMGSAGLLNDTYTWTSGSLNWTLQSPSTSPGARTQCASTYRVTSNTVLIFGGQTATGYSNQLWSWNGSTWSNITPGGTSPSARYKAQMVYDTATGLVMLFGGQDVTGVLNDTWSWNGTVWTQIFPSLVPPARIDASMVYDTLTGTIVLSGGHSSTGSLLGDIWSWNGVTWSLVPPLTLSPFPRANAASAYDSATNTILLFGGDIAGAVVGDTWSWSFGAFPIAISTCNPQTATTLGIPVPQQATPPTAVLSAYFYPLPAATPILQTWAPQLDWYDVTGALLGSSVGTSVTEQPGTWVRAYVVGSPPAGAMYFGRTIKSTTFSSGDKHLMDAVKVEWNTQATPGPTPWDPPRDIKISLFPNRRNLVTNAQGLSGTVPWAASGGTIQASWSMATPTGLVRWPANTQAGFVLTSTAGGSLSQSMAIPVMAGLIYSFSAYVEPATTARSVQLSVQFVDTNSHPIGTPLTATFNEALNIFVRGSLVDLLAPVGAVGVSASLVVLGTATSEVHYTGGFLFEPQSYLLPFFDANSGPPTDFMWEGTPNLSVSDFYPSLMAKLSRLVTVVPEYIPIGSTFSLILQPK